MIHHLALCSDTHNHPPPSFPNTNLHALLHAGDIYDAPTLRHPTSNLEPLHQWIRTTTLPVYAVRGNHDFLDPANFFSTFHDLTNHVTRLAPNLLLAGLGLAYPKHSDLPTNRDLLDPTTRILKEARRLKLQSPHKSDHLLLLTHYPAPSIENQKCGGAKIENPPTYPAIPALITELESTLNLPVLAIIEGHLHHLFRTTANLPHRTHPIPIYRPGPQGAILQIDDENWQMEYPSLLTTGDPHMATQKPDQRRMALHRLLSKHRRVVASELAKDWGCDQRTIRRDLSRMRDVDHLPVEFNAHYQTWRYTHDVAEIHPMLVSVEDRRALLFSLRAAAQLEDTPVSTQVRRLYQGLLQTLPVERATQFERMMKSVCFTGPRTPPIKKPVWDVVLLSLEARETMRATYTDGYHGSTTERDLDPYGLMMRDRRWILVAYCHLRREVLTFSLHRITHAQTTDTPFQVPADFMDRYLDDAFEGTQSTGEKRKVKLRIVQDAPQYVQDRQWSGKESRTLDRQGNIIVEFQTAALFAVEREVCAEQGWVELMEPAESRSASARRGERWQTPIGNYRTRFVRWGGYKAGRVLHNKE